jgi:hypothetical protein
MIMSLVTRLSQFIEMERFREFGALRVLLRLL